MALLVVLLVDPKGEFSFGQELVSSLASVGVTSVAVVRDADTVGVVLEGWLFDPARSAAAAAAALGTSSGARTLHPVLHLAVPATANQGGRDVLDVPNAHA